jgi:hypothetical protein
MVFAAVFPGCSGYLHSRELGSSLEINCRDLPIRVGKSHFFTNSAVQFRWPGRNVHCCSLAWLFRALAALKGVGIFNGDQLYTVPNEKSNYHVYNEKAMFHV